MGNEKNDLEARVAALEQTVGGFRIMFRTALNTYLASDTVAELQNIDVPEDVSNSTANKVEKIAEKVELALEVEEEVVLDSGSDPLKEDLMPGVRIRIESDDARNGLIGVIVEKKRSWVVMKIEKGNDKYDSNTQVSVRKNTITVLEGEKHNPSQETLDDATEPLASTYVHSQDGPGNARLKRGVHIGKSVHEVFTDVENGVRFLTFIAKKNDYSVYDEKLVNDVKKYLEMRGVEIA